MIILYDFPSTPENKLWSSATLKVRMALNYKSIQYTVECVDYPDVASTLKKLGGVPTVKLPDGSDFYTLPAIRDTDTDQVIIDSLLIVEYLDRKYPGTPMLVPAGLRAPIYMFDAVAQETCRDIFMLAIAGTVNILTPRGAEYYRSTREAYFGKKLEDMAPPGPLREEAWKKARASLDRLAGYFEKNGEDTVYFIGDSFTFPDFVLAAFMTYVRIVLGPDSEEWNALASMNNGRWGKLLEATEYLRT